MSAETEIKPIECKDCRWYSGGEHTGTCCYNPPTVMFADEKFWPSNRPETGAHDTCSMATPKIMRHNFGDDGWFDAAKKKPAQARVVIGYGYDVSVEPVIYSEQSDIWFTWVGGKVDRRVQVSHWQPFPYPPRRGE